MIVNGNLNIMIARDHVRWKQVSPAISDREIFRKHSDAYNDFQAAVLLWQLRLTLMARSVSGKECNAN